MTTEYRLRIMSQQPIIISEAQFNACKDENGQLKFGRSKEIVQFGRSGVNLFDVRGWEVIDYDPMPEGFTTSQTRLNHPGIEKMRLHVACFEPTKLRNLTPDEQTETTKIHADWQKRKNSPDYDLRSQFDKAFFDVYFIAPKDREEAFRQFKKEQQVAQELEGKVEEVFFDKPNLTVIAAKEALEAIGQPVVYQEFKQDDLPF